MKKSLSLKSLKPYFLSGVALLFSIGFYLWIQGLPDSQPLFLLQPIADIVSGFTSLRFLWRQDIGFLGMTRSGFSFVINKSCSGGVFFSISFSLLSITQLPRFKKAGQQLIAVFAFLAFSYLVAIVASVLRIIPSIAAFDMRTGLDPVLIHNALGMVTFVTFISLSYLFVNYIVSKIICKVGGINEQN